jgi:hypothetical protein
MFTHLVHTGGPEFTSSANSNGAYAVRPPAQQEIRNNALSTRHANGRGLFAGGGGASATAGAVDTTAREVVLPNSKTLDDFTVHFMRQREASAATVRNSAAAFVAENAVPLPPGSQVLQVMQCEYVGEEVAELEKRFTALLHEVFRISPTTALTALSSEQARSSSVASDVLMLTAETAAEFRTLMQSELGECIGWLYRDIVSFFDRMVLADILDREERKTGLRHDDLVKLVDAVSKSVLAQFDVRARAALADGKPGDDDDGGGGSAIDNQLQHDATVSYATGRPNGDDAMQLDAVPEPTDPAQLALQLAQQTDAMLDLPLNMMTRLHEYMWYLTSCVYGTTEVAITFKRKKSAAADDYARLLKAEKDLANARNVPKLEPVPARK